jgi:ankyrin repeat protein
MKTSVDDCKAAMKDDGIDDATLVGMFHACVNPIGLVACAIVRNCERAMRLLIAEGFDLSDIDEIDRTFLHLAYEFSSLGIINMLLAAGLDVTARDIIDTLPWHNAAHNLDESVMAHLIANGIDVNTADAGGFSLAHRAAGNPNEKVLASLIAAGADVTTEDDDGNTCCHYAVANSNTAVIALLIPLSDVDATNFDGNTPCISAVIHRNPSTLALLIDAGANASIANDNGKTACSFAVDNKDDKVLELLVDANVDINVVGSFDGATAMHVAALWGNHRLLAKLIAAGGDVNAVRPRDKSAPCHLICKLCDPDAAFPDDATAEKAFQSLSLLLAAKADVHARDARGTTLLHSAVESGFCESVSLLLSSGADVEARNKHGRTPVFFARDNRILALLIAAKADVNAVDAKGLTACHRTCARPRLLSQLIAAGANPLVRGKRGQTPLHYAAMQKNGVETIPLLIGANSDVNLCDNAGNAAGHWAANSGCVENLKLLLAHGVQINQRNNVGKTMLCVAASAPANAVELMQLLMEAGADTSVIDDAVARGANASVLPMLRSFGVNLSAVDENGNTPCHGAGDSALVSLFALGATMSAVNKDGKTPYDLLCARDTEAFDEALVTFVAAGLGVDVQTQLESPDIAAVVIAGGGRVSQYAYIYSDELVQEERIAYNRIVERQTDLFRARAFHICVGMQSLRLSALEMCEILVLMFTPLESLVPFHVVWKLVTTVKHFK